MLEPGFGSGQTWQRSARRHAARVFEEPHRSLLGEPRTSDAAPAEKLIRPGGPKTFVSTLWAWEAIRRISACSRGPSQRSPP
ncbi:hypothetical protein ACFV2H_45800 [Streptomyces sp. NPDC059629]|uniref:hypothetical protein n=1 Tax=Streptomyces sp. NPDC059629 TaxID=3346889 RepID=UPI0036BB1F35